MPTYTSRSRCEPEHGKVIFFTEQDAQDTLSRIRRMRESGFVYRQERRAYLCPHNLEHWHLTSQAAPVPAAPEPAPAPAKVKGPASNYWAPEELELLQDPFTTDDVAMLTGRTYWAVARKLHQLDLTGETTAIRDAPLAVAQHRAIGRDFRMTAAELESLGRMTEQ